MMKLSSKLTYQVNHGGQHLELTSSCFECGISRRPVEQSWDHPTPAFDRLFLFDKGHATIRQNRKRIKLHPGIIYLLPTRLSFRVTYSAGSVLYYFHLINTDVLGTPIFAGCNGVQELLDHELLFRQIVDLSKAERLVEALPYIQSAVTALAIPIVTESQKTERKVRKYDWIREAAETRGFDELSVESLAAEQNVNRSALSQAFRRDVGLPLKRYLTQIMINRACDRLTFTEQPIKEVAYDLGFPENYYFHRYFKKHVGATPTEYRVNSRRS